MPTIPDSTKNSLHWRLADRARQRWPNLAEVWMRYRAGFAYVDGVLPDGQVLRLCRLRYLRSATTWGFAIYRASHDNYEDNFLPSESPTGSAEETLGCACGLYLADPTIWTSTPDVSTTGTTSSRTVMAGIVVAVDGVRRCLAKFTVVHVHRSAAYENMTDLCEPDQDH